MRFRLPDLPYEMNDLEPNISKTTLGFHYGKHHQAYVRDLNSMLQGTKFKNLDLETIIRVSDGPVFNNASQVWNHTFYFEGLKPGNNNSMTSRFSDVIKSNFGSESFLKNSFFKTSISLFGAGWVWLVLNPKGSMEIVSESNAGNPLRIGLIPLMTCDLWEHAYYLDYQNRRKDYLEAFWKLVNWEIIEKRYNEVTLSAE